MRNSALNVNAKPFEPSATTQNEQQFNMPFNMQKVFVLFVGHLHYKTTPYKLIKILDILTGEEGCVLFCVRYQNCFARVVLKTKTAYDKLLSFDGKLSYSYVSDDPHNRTVKTSKITFIKPIQTEIFTPHPIIIVKPECISSPQFYGSLFPAKNNDKEGNANLFIGTIPRNITNEELTEILNKIAGRNCVLDCKRQLRKTKCCAFAMIDTADSLEKIISQNGSVFSFTNEKTVTNDDYTHFTSIEERNFFVFEHIRPKKNNLTAETEDNLRDENALAIVKPECITVKPECISSPQFYGSLFPAKNNDKEGNANLFIGTIPRNITNEELTEILNKIAGRNCVLDCKRQLRKTKCCAFAMIDTADSLEKIISQNGSVFSFNNEKIVTNNDYTHFALIEERNFYVFEHTRPKKNNLTAETEDNLCDGNALAVEQSTFW